VLGQTGNTDETLFIFDMLTSITIHARGSKSVPLTTAGMKI
jgi:hypothetical protein